MQHIGRLALVVLLVVGAAAMYSFGRFDAGFRLPRGSLARTPPPGERLARSVPRFAVAIMKNAWTRRP